VNWIRMGPSVGLVFAVLIVISNSESHLMPDMLLSKCLLSDHSPYYFSYYIFVLELLRRKHLSFFPV
jgi:hypothetical protein